MPRPPRVPPRGFGSGIMGLPGTIGTEASTFLVRQSTLARMPPCSNGTVRKMVEKYTIISDSSEGEPWTKSPTLAIPVRANRFLNLGGQADHSCHAAHRRGLLHR